MCYFLIKEILLPIVTTGIEALVGAYWAFRLDEKKKLKIKSFIQQQL